MDSVPDHRFEIAVDFRRNAPGRRHKSFSTTRRRQATIAYQHPGDWLDAHNVNAGVIITGDAVVALFNMIAALLIILLERTSMIGTLKALGMGTAPCRRHVQIRSSFVIIKGMFWGNVVGIGLCLLQHCTGWISLSQGGMFLTTVPIFHRLGVAGAAECRDLPVHCSAAGFADDDNFTNFAGENDPLRIVPNDETL